MEDKNTIEFKDLDEEVKKYDQIMFELVDRDLKQEQLNNLVNRLIKQSFGRGFKGTCEWVPGDIETGSVYTRNYCVPYQICKTLLHLWPIGRWVRCAGFFPLRDGKYDGSLLKVYREYIDHAKKYAILYKEETGKDVEIKII